MFSNSFVDKGVMAELVARMLWEIGAVHFRADDPYKLASGMASPVYIDCRKLISYPRIRSAVMDFAAATIMRSAGFEKIDVVAGGETAGIPFAALLADRLGLPMRRRLPPSRPSSMRRSPGLPSTAAWRNCRQPESLWRFGAGSTKSIEKKVREDEA